MAVPFDAVIMICDFRVKLFTNVYVYVFFIPDPEGGGDLPMDGL